MTALRVYGLLGLISMLVWTRYKASDVMAKSKALLQVTPPSGAVALALTMLLLIVGVLWPLFALAAVLDFAHRKRS